MNNIIALLLCFMILLSSCTIKENQLVIINDPGSNINKPSAKLKDWQTDTISQKALIEKYREVIAKINKDVAPIAISPDYTKVICYKRVEDKNADAINSMVIAGNMAQKMELFVYNTTNGTIKSLGEFMSIKSFQFDQDGKQWAFIDGENNVYIYNLENERLQKVIEKHNYRDFSTICWSRDSKRLMFDNRMIFDIASKEFVSIAADSYTPFIRMKFSNNTFITEMKNNKYENIIALYNFDNKTYTQIADGYYKDSDNTNLIYTVDLMQGLKVVNLKTFESKTIEDGPVYCANILKSTGEIVYTTLNTNFDDERYLLVKINPETMEKQTFPLCTPTFFLSPAEDKLYFIPNYSENTVTVDLETLKVNKVMNKTDDEDLNEIKSVILKMFLLDYNFEGNFEEYEIEAKKIYTNTDYPIPQEALNNKLADFKRFNTPLPSFQKEEYIPSDLKLYSINIRNNRASINIGRFFINSIELIKIDNNWYITGFSTHPESKEVAQIRNIVQKHINDIMSGNKKEALKYWDENDDSEYTENNRNIVENLINNRDKLVMEVGETELWAMSVPHRAESPASATEARTKIIIRDGKSTIKYKVVLSKINKEEFIIKTWDTDPLSVSQLY